MLVQAQAPSRSRVNSLVSEGVCHQHRVFSPTQPTPGSMSSAGLTQTDRNPGSGWLRTLVHAVVMSLNHPSARPSKPEGSESWLQNPCRQSPGRPLTATGRPATGSPRPRRSGSGRLNSQGFRSWAAMLCLVFSMLAAVTPAAPASWSSGRFVARRGASFPSRGRRACWWSAPSCWDGAGAVAACRVAERGTRGRSAASPGSARGIPGRCRRAG